MDNISIVVLIMLIASVVVATVVWRERGRRYWWHGVVWSWRSVKHVDHMLHLDCTLPITSLLAVWLHVCFVTGWWFCTKHATVSRAT